jgi:hypothetical protein
VPIPKNNRRRDDNMSRRDKFAMATLTGLISSRSGPMNQAEFQQFSLDSFKMADAMIKRDASSRT